MDSVKFGDAFPAFVLTNRSSLHAHFQESSRAEERLRALFVASDVDGDGNLDFQVQQSMSSCKAHTVFSAQECV